MTTTRTRRLATVGAALLLGSLTLAGCSSSSDDTATSTPSATVSASPTTSAAAFCNDATAAKASLKGIVDINVLQDGTDALKSNFATFKADADTLIASAQVQFAPETEAVKSSLAALQTAIDALKEKPSVTEVAALAPALASIKTSTEALFEAIDDAC